MNLEPKQKLSFVMTLILLASLLFIGLQLENANKENNVEKNKCEPLKENNSAIKNSKYYNQTLKACMNPSASQDFKNQSP